MILYRGLASPLAPAVLLATLLGGCASLPPGSNFPKTDSAALAHPEDTRLGGQFEEAARAHGGNSGFHLIPVGADGFAARVEMIDAAQKTLDLQYYIFRGDETGRLLTDATLRAADRGVRVRVLLDDGETLAKDDQLIALDAHPSIEIRFFNPWRYRGHLRPIRASEFMLDKRRLNRRMHNKLLVVDNEVALIGGRNIGDEYFQIDPATQFADDDVFAAGPIAQQLSTTFDEFWKSPLSIPAEALLGGKGKRTDTALADVRAKLAEQMRQPSTGAIDYVKRGANHEPLAGILSGRLPLVWAPAQLVYDSPDRKHPDQGPAPDGQKQQPAIDPVIDALAALKTELLMVTPFFVPGDEGMDLLKTLRHRNVQVCILTNSLESTNGSLAAHSGYMKYRLPLLQEGVRLYEVRSLLGNTAGSGQTAALSQFGNYSLHAKLYVFDQQRLFVGSMNFDQRSMHLNTEIGLIIDSPELARQTVARFDAMTQPVNSYELSLRPLDAAKAQHLVWLTQENAKAVELDKEPARSATQRRELKLLSLVPLDSEL